MTTIIVSNPFLLSDEEYERIELMAAANFRPWQIAIALDIEAKEAFVKCCLNQGNEVYNHYHKGILVHQADVDSKLGDQAKKGNITAIQIHDIHSRNRYVDNLKEKYFS